MTDKKYLDKIKGVIYGMAIGDSMGMPSELWGKNKVKKFFGEIKDFLDGPKENQVAKIYKRGQFTDDTAQALAIIDSLQTTFFVPNKTKIGLALLTWAKKANAFDNGVNILGDTSKNVLLSISKNENPEIFAKNALTNGSAMRIAPIGCLFRSNQKKQLSKYVYDVSSLTHSSDVGIAGASIIAMAVSSAIEDLSFEKIIKNIYEIEKISRALGNETFSPSFKKRIKIGLEIANKYKNNDKTFLNEVYDIVGAGVSMIQSVPAAITIAYYAKNVEHCALLCANLAGDTDTIGCMASAIMGAKQGYSKIDSKFINLIDESNDINLLKYSEIVNKGRKITWKL